MNQCFIKDWIYWEIAVSIALDNPNTNVGNNNSIKTRITEKIRNASQQVGTVISVI